jgi:hypothetical protein
VVEDLHPTLLTHLGLPAVHRSPGGAHRPRHRSGG